MTPEQSGEQLRICPLKQRRASMIRAIRRASDMGGIGVSFDHPGELDIYCQSDCEGSVYKQRTLLGITLPGFKEVCPTERSKTAVSDDSDGHNISMLDLSK